MEGVSASASWLSQPHQCCRGVASHPSHFPCPPSALNLTSEAFLPRSGPLCVKIDISPFPLLTCLLSGQLPKGSLFF